MIFQYGSASQNIINLYPGTDGGLNFGLYDNSTSYFAGSWVGSLAVGKWFHVVGQRRNGAVECFLNGIKGATVASSTTALRTPSGRTFAVGRSLSNGTQYFDGYLDDLRITKGVARYAQNFTPPTRAFATTPLSTYADYDPFFESLVFALKGQGTHASTQATSDVGGYSLTWQNGMTISNTASRFYGTSLAATANNKYITVADTAALEPAANDWTISFWVYLNSTTGYRQAVRKNGTKGVMSLLLYNGRAAFTVSANDSIWSIDNSSTAPTSLVTGWQHIEYARSGNTIYVFVNGTLSYSVAFSSSIADSSGSWDLARGDQTASDGTYYNDFRYYRGVCLHTSSFAPPRVPMATAAGIVTSGLVALLDAGDAASYDGTSQTWKNICLTSSDDAALANVVLLMHMEDLTDSMGRQTLSNSGAVAASSSQARFGTKSCDFTAGGYLIANSADFNFGTGDFTIEFWCWKSATTQGGIFQTNSSALPFDGTNGLGLQWAAGEGWVMYANGQRKPGGSFTANTWHHVAISRQSGTMYLFINGTVLGTWSDSINYSGTYFGIGSIYSTGFGWGGYLDEFRVTKGVGRYTANFTPSTVPFPAPGDYHFYRGSGSGVDGADPTFAGIAGGRSANDYFSFDGGDYLTPVGSNPPLLDSLHKDNAAFTVVVLVKRVTSSQIILFSTSSATASDRISLNATGSSLRFQALGSSTTNVDQTKSLGVPVGSWAFCAVSVNEAGGATGSFLYCNGNYSTFDAGFSTLSSAAGGKAGILARGADGVGPATSGTLLSIFQIYSRALTKAELDQNFAAMRSRFGM